MSRCRPRLCSDRNVPYHKVGSAINLELVVLDGWAARVEFLASRRRVAPEASGAPVASARPMVAPMVTRSAKMAIEAEIARIEAA